MLISPSRGIPPFSPNSPMAVRGSSFTGLTGPVESASEDVSDPLNNGSWCTGSYGGRVDAVDEVLVLVLKNPPNVRGGTVWPCADTADPESGGKVEVGVDAGVSPLADSPSELVHNLKPHREDAVLGCFA